MDAPKISVIIPMYNAEKFIRQTLISVLASKFTDYEVLVVDDCSTDNSVAEAEKLLPHFDGRLKIFSTQTNSGGAGVPRNVGIKNSAGKYICFHDADDFILPSALENFFTVAEYFQADVVHTEKFFAFNDRGEINFRREDLILRHDEAGDPVTIPTPEPAAVAERIRRCAEGKFLWMPWGKFFRREFLIANEIYFPDMALTEDLVFYFKCLCLAKNYLRVPFVTTVYRVNQNSVSKKNGSVEDSVKLWWTSIFEGFELIANFMDATKFFQDNPDAKYLAMKFLTATYLSFVEQISLIFEPHEIQKILFDELNNSASNSTGKNIFLAQMCTERLSTE